MSKEVLDNENLIEVDASFNMKKYFKSPDDIQELPFKDYQMKRLKKALSKDLVNAPFLFVTDFKFSDEEAAPMLFLGSTTTFWKQAIKTYKKSKTYASGTCTLVEKEGKTALELEISSGKGETALNLKKINKILLKKLGIVAEFVEGKETKKGVLDTIKDTIKDAILGDEDGPKKGVESAVTNIVARIQTEVGLFKAIPEKDTKERMDQIKLLELLVAEWENNHPEDKQSKEHLYIVKVKLFLVRAKGEYNGKNLQQDNLKELAQDFKDYQEDRRQYEADYEFVNEKGLSLDDREPELPEDAYKSFYQELQIQLGNIKNWRGENPNPSSSLAKQLDALELTIRKEQEQLAAKVPNIEKLDKNQQKIQVLYDALQVYIKEKTAFINSQNKQLDKSLQEKTFKQYYNTLKGLEQQALDWKTAHPSAASGDIKTLETTQKRIVAEIKALNNNIPESDRVDNFEIQKFKEQFEEYLKDKNAFLKDQYSKGKPDELTPALVKFYDNLDTILSATRDWKKQNSEVSKHDLSVLDTLENKIREEYKVIEKLIPQNEKDQLYKNKGYNPKELENLAEHTKLPQLNTSIPETGNYAEIMNAYRAYGKMPAGDVEAKRLKLLELATYIETWETAWNKLGKLAKKLDLLGTKREPEVLKLKKVIFEIIKNLGAFGVQRDNFLPIKDQHRQFVLLAKEYKDYEQKGEEYDDSGVVLNKSKTAYHELKEKMEDKLEDLIDAIETLVQEWQKLHNNLSGFGTNEKNKYVETVRKDIHAFAIQKSLIHEDATAVLKTKKKYSKNDSRFDAAIIKMNDYNKKKSWKNSAAHIDGIEQVRTKLTTFNFWASGCEEDEELKKRKLRIKEYEDKLNKDLEELKKDKDAEAKLANIKNLKAQIAAEEKALKAVIAKAEKAKSAEKNEKKDGPKKDKLKDALGIFEKAIVNHDTKLTELYVEWETAYEKLDTKVQNNYKTSNNTVILHQEGHRKKVIALDQSAKIIEKDKLYEDILTVYKKAEFAYKGNLSSVQKEAKELKIKNLERLIKDWDNVAVLAKSSEDTEKYSQQINELLLIQKALVTERKKLQEGAKIREDVLYDNLLLQFDKIEKEKPSEAITTSIQNLLSAIDIWKKKNPNSKAIGYEDKHIEVDKIKEALLEKMRNEDTSIFFLAKQFDELVTQMNKRLDSYGNSKIGFDKKEIQNQKDSIAQSVKKPRAVLDDAMKKNDLKQALETLKEVEEIQFSMDSVIQKMLIINNEENRKKEQLELSAFDGFDAYNDFDNVKGSISEKDKAKMQECISKAVERANHVKELGGSIDDAKRMLEHIPVAFWPDSFIESMRLWQEAEEAFYGNIVKETFSNKDLKDGFSAKDIAVQSAKAIKDVTDILNTGKIKITALDGKKLEFDIFSKVTTEAPKPTMNAIDATIGVDIISDFIAGGGDIKKILETKEGKKRAELVGRFLVDSTERLCNASKSVLDSTVVGVAAKAAQADQYTKIASAVFSGAAILIKAVKDGEKVGKEGINAYIKKDFAEAVAKTAELLIKAGSTVASLTKVIAGAVQVGLGVGAAGASVAGMVGGVAGVAVNAFATMSDALELGKLIHKIVKDVHEKSKMVELQNFANQEDSIMKHSLHREVRSMNIKIGQDAINIIGQSVELAGSATSTVGSAVSLVPYPEVMAAGTAVSITGTALKISGKAIKLGGNVVVSLIDEKDRVKVEKLMVLARKGDRKAREEVLRNSRKYAKMFLAVGVMQTPPDPVALEFCVQHGITEKDLNDEPKATKVLSKLMSKAGESMDEASITTKIGNTVGLISGTLTSVKDFFKTRDIQAIQLNKKSLKSDITKLHLEYSSVHRNSMIAAFLTGVSPISALVALKLDSEAQKIKDQLKDIKTNLTLGASDLEDKIDKLYDEIKDLNKELKTKFSDELFEKSLQLEREIEVNEDFVQTLKEGIDSLKEFKL